MLPVVSIVGRSNSGKTTLVEKLVRELKGRGYRVGTVKHHAHGEEMDRPGKDSWRHAEGGAEVVAVSSPRGLAVFRRVERELSLGEIVGLLEGLVRVGLVKIDLILTEGYKREGWPKIEVIDPAVCPEPLCGKEDNLLAVACDRPLETGVPCFRRDDARGLADLIEEGFLKGRVEGP